MPPTAERAPDLHVLDQSIGLEFRDTCAPRDVCRANTQTKNLFIAQLGRFGRTQQFEARYWRRNGGQVLHFAVELEEFRRQDGER